MDKVIGNIVRKQITRINVIPETLRLGLESDIPFLQYSRTVMDKHGNVMFYIKTGGNDVNSHVHIPIRKNSGRIDINSLIAVLTLSKSHDNRFNSAWKHLEHLWAEQYLKFPNLLEQEILRLRTEYLELKKRDIVRLFDLLEGDDLDTRNVARKMLDEIEDGCYEYLNLHLHQFFCSEFSNICLVKGIVDFDLTLKKEEMQNIFGTQGSMTFPVMEQLKVNKKGGRGVLELAEYLQHLSDYALHVKENLLPSQPVTFSNSRTEPCINFFDLSFKDNVKEQSTPAWDEVLSKFDDDEAECLKAYLYSCFDAKNKGKQCLTLLDNGDTGKSSMLNALSTVLGSQLYQSMQKDSFSNQFAMAKVWNKRLIAIPDCKNSKILHGEKIHQLLGNDGVEVEEKGEKSFNATPNVKLLICTNTPLEINAYAAHERTRIIMLHPRMTKDLIEKLAQRDESGNLITDANGNYIILGDPTFTDRLVAEFWPFLAKCEKSYKELCPNNGNIKLPVDKIEAMGAYSSVEDDEYESIYDLIKHDKDRHITSNDLRVFFEFHSRKDFRNFSVWLQKSKKIIKKTKKINGMNKNVYEGIYVQSGFQSK